jgi:ubiquitin-conjugating enzyme E2 J1
MPPSPYNSKNTTIKRIMKEVKELSEDTCVDYAAWPLDENIFEFHFTVRGPRDSPFEGGMYHGKILLPPEYPFKPPHFYFLTPSGRFEVGRKICLTISSYHPESWQPSWSIRTALIAIIGFFPSPAHGAIGSVDATDEVRISMAKKSVDWSCPDCKAHNETVLREKAEALEAQGVEARTALDLSDDVTAQMQLMAPPPTPTASPAASPAASQSTSRLPEAAAAKTPAPATPTKAAAPATPAPSPLTTSSSAAEPATPPSATKRAPAAAPPSAAPAASPARPAAPSRPAADRSVLVLNVAIAAVVTAIVAIIAKKVIDGE